MKIYSLKGDIRLLSGLHIGGGDDVMKIGGIDNQVIKDANSGRPYIPASSLKGKIRSLLEWDLGLVGLDQDKKGAPFSYKNIERAKDRKSAEILLKLFGDSDVKENKFGITRISFSDCRISPESEDKILSEAKYENIIDRQEGTAEHPRQSERVPEGIKFCYDFKIKVLEDDDIDDFKKLIKRGLNLLENDYLGGSGSRGYGRVEFSNKDEWVEK